MLRLFLKDRSIPTREIHGLRLMLIYFYVPAPIPRLHWHAASLHVSNNTSRFGICYIRKLIIE